MVQAALFGLVIGAVIGLLGAGGSILAVPALVYGVGVPLASAVPTSLVVVAVSALGGLAVRLRCGLIRWPVAFVFVAASMPAAFAGAALGRLVPARWSLLAFAVVMAVAGLRMLSDRERPGGACRARGGEVNWRRCLPRALVAGSAVGTLTGLFGVGGGFVIVPVLTMLLGLTAVEAVATSLVVVSVTAVAGLAAHAATLPDIDPGITVAFAATALVSAVLAGRLGHRLPAETVRRAFAGVVLVVAVGVATSAIAFPAHLAAEPGTPVVDHATESRTVADPGTHDTTVRWPVAPAAASVRSRP